jgi:seryl-tRNA synthetase
MVEEEKKDEVKEDKAKMQEAPPEPKEEFNAKAAYEELAAKVATLMDTMDKVMALLEEDKQEVNEVPPAEPVVAEQGKHSKEIADLTVKIDNLEKKLAQFGTGIKKTVSSEVKKVEVDEAYEDLKRKGII